MNRRQAGFCFSPIEEPRCPVCGECPWECLCEPTDDVIDESIIAAADEACSEYDEIEES